MTTTNRTRTCLICGTNIAAKPTGRPPTFCSTGCRRMAEYDIKRLNATIVELEDQARRLRDPARIPYSKDAEHAEFIQAEIGDAREKLRELLVDR